MEDGGSLGSLGLSSDSPEVGESGSSILWDSMVRPRGELEVEYLPRLPTQLGVCVCVCVHAHVEGVVM